jgi:hypothetical protein
VESLSSGKCNTLLKEVEDINKQEDISVPEKEGLMLLRWTISPN